MLGAQVTISLPVPLNQTQKHSSRAYGLIMLNTYLQSHNEWGSNLDWTLSIPKPFVFQPHPVTLDETWLNQQTNFTVFVFSILEENVKNHFIKLFHLNTLKGLWGSSRALVSETRMWASSWSDQRRGMDAMLLMTGTMVTDCTTFLQSPCWLGRRPTQKSTSREVTRPKIWIPRTRYRVMQVSTCL